MRAPLRYPRALGYLPGIVIFLGFNLTFFPQFIMGSRGMPRRYARYLPEFEVFHQMSTIGSMVLGLTLPP